jgi:membrane associated rhomboid family serine protease
MSIAENPPKWTLIFIGVCFVFFFIQNFIVFFSKNLTEYWIYLMFIPRLSLSMPWMFVTSIFLHANFSHIIFMPWMFVTSIFLHANFSHIIFNMFALFFFGIYLERIIGRKAFLSLFLVSGVLGNVGHMLVTSNPYVPSVGASGAVYGIMGALAVLAPFLMVFIYGMIPVPMIVAAILWGMMDLIGLFTPSGIAHGAHLIGMLAGIIYGFYLKIIFKRRIKYL